MGVEMRRVGLQGSWVWGELIVRFGPFFLAPFSDQARMCRPLSSDHVGAELEFAAGKDLAAGDGPRGPEG